jgi:2-polyprenyl-6-methoxyphenol hydroxylase-like FAD-dependent oxidoreductase
MEVGERRCFALKRVLAEQYLKDRLLLIGDAAHSVHPLAGQGLNLGLRDVACLSTQIQGFGHGQRAWRAYERERKSENTIAAHGFDTIAAAFLLGGSVALVRDAVLKQFEGAKAVKAFAAELAAGRLSQAFGPLSANNPP